MFTLLFMTSCQKDEFQSIDSEDSLEQRRKTGEKKRDRNCECELTFVSAEFGASPFANEFNLYFSNAEGVGTPLWDPSANVGPIFDPVPGTVFPVNMGHDVAWNISIQELGITVPARYNFLLQCPEDESPREIALGTGPGQSGAAPDQWFQKEERSLCKRCACAIRIESITPSFMIPDVFLSDAAGEDFNNFPDLTVPGVQFPFMRSLDWASEIAYNFRFQAISGGGMFSETNLSYKIACGHIDEKVIAWDLIPLREAIINKGGEPATVNHQWLSSFDECDPIFMSEEVSIGDLDN